MKKENGVPRTQIPRHLVVTLLYVGGTSIFLHCDTFTYDRNYLLFLSLTPATRVPPRHCSIISIYIVIYRQTYKHMHTYKQLRRHERNCWQARNNRPPKNRLNSVVPIDRNAGAVCHALSRVSKEETQISQHACRDRLPFNPPQLLRRLAVIRAHVLNVSTLFAGNWHDFISRTRLIAREIGRSVFRGGIYF